MKKIRLMFGAVCVVAVLGFSSCGSTPAAEKPGASAPKVSKHVEREIIDWKGASVGATVPDWVIDAVEEDYKSLSKLPNLSKKKILCAEAQGRNLDLLKSWVNNFNVQATLARSISNFVSANFGGELSGSKDSGLSENFMDELVATFSKTEINGFSKEMDFWTLTRVIDKDKDSNKDIYEYFVVYAIDQEQFDYQIARALGLVEAKNEAEAEMKSRIESAMTENRVWAERELER